MIVVVLVTAEVAHSNMTTIAVADTAGWPVHILAFLLESKGIVGTLSGKPMGAMAGAIVICEPGTSAVTKTVIDHLFYSDPPRPTYF
jgi:hypothetical protein